MVIPLPTEFSEEPGSETGYMTKQFNASSDLSKFGKQDVYVASREPIDENAIARLDQEIFLNNL